MIQIRYISRSVEAMSAEKLLALLQRCLSNNAKSGVTGMLLYGNDTFLQALEGEESVVDDLFEKIKSDPRHDSVQLLQRKRISGRQYAEWSMGFKRISDKELQGIGGLGNFGERDFTLNYLAQHGDVVEVLMKHYREPYWDPLVRELDAQNKALKDLKWALTTTRRNVEVASLMLESVVDASVDGNLSDKHLDLCKLALETLRRG